MRAITTILLIFPILIIHALPLTGEAACNCGSTDASNPCTGQAIAVTVKAYTPNGGTAVDSQYNWNFNSGGNDARCGQFVNGDYWIAPAAGQSSVTVTSITSNGSVYADVNPTTESMGLMSGSKNYGNYNAAENIIPNLPQSYSTTTSIVAAVQRNETSEGNCGTSSIIGQCIDSYNIVTILASVPALAGAETIRPNITGKSKEIISLSDLDLTRLPRKSFLTGTTTAGLEDIRQRWSHSTEIFGLHNSVGANGGYCSEGGRAFRSHIILDDYGGGVAAQWYNDLMVLFSDDNSMAAKKPALAAMLSYGLDLYHAMYDAPSGLTRHWGTGATQHPGKFITSAFFAALAKDTKYANNLKTAGAHSHDTYYAGPLEFSQVNNKGNGPVWGDTPSYVGIYYQGSYWSDLMKSQCYDGATGTCDQNNGAKTMLDPYGYIDGPPPKAGGGYMTTSLGVQRSMVATMFLMPEICEVANYDDLVNYVDRVASSGLKKLPDQCVTPDSRENVATCDPYRNTGCQYYGVTWGPIDPTNINSQCITAPTPPYNKSGRFSNINGNIIKALYTSSQIEINWATIRGSSSSCRIVQSPSQAIIPPKGFKALP